MRARVGLVTLNDGHILFAYGSLINRESRGRSFRAPDGRPARLRGVRQSWSLPVPGEAVTGLGLAVAEDGHCNGVLLEISDTELQKADQREIPAGYQRHAADWSHVAQGQDDRRIESSWRQRPLWVYRSVKSHEATTERPIIQSYLDVVLTGCLEIGVEFAREFVTTTDGWDAPWIDDRGSPRYLRPHHDPDRQVASDALLQELVPEALKNRRLA